MAAQILINQSFREIRVARVENNELVEFYVERKKDMSLVGNIYKGRVSRVLPGMQAAFVDLGLPKAGFLYAGNVYDPSKEESSETPIDDEADESSQAVVLESSTDNDSEFPLHKSISELVHEGESVLVQVIKEPLGTKGARLTGHLSIPGRFLVYLPNSKHLGVSRRIENDEERDRLKKIVSKNRPTQGGFIVRTVAEGVGEKHLKDDMDYLVRSWGNIQKAADKQKGIGLIYSDLDLATRIIRDRVTEDVERIMVDDLELYKRVTKFVQNALPRFKKRIEIHDKKSHIFELFGIETEINRALGRKVWLKSGGYIVIDETEALTTIDVNSGRFVGSRNLEDTILQTNIEAVKEIAYQIRLRNLGGIIVLDFIDMQKSQHKERIYEALQTELQKDPVKTNILPISELGLIEMTRKRTQESLRKKLLSTCSYCDGRGSTKSRETLAAQLIRDCIKESRQAASSSGNLAVYCHPSLASYFAEDDREAVEYLEKATNLKLIIKADPNLHSEEYEIFDKDS